MIAFTHRHICRWVFIFIKKASHRCGICLIHDWFSFYSYCSVFGSVVSVPASPPVLSWSGGSVAAGSGSAVTGASVIVGASVTAAGASSPDCHLDLYLHHCCHPDPYLRKTGPYPNWMNYCCPWKRSSFHCCCHCFLYRCKYWIK